MITQEIFSEALEALLASEANLLRVMAFDAIAGKVVDLATLAVVLNSEDEEVVVTIPGASSYSAKPEMVFYLMLLGVEDSDAYYALEAPGMGQTVEFSAAVDGEDLGSLLVDCFGRISGK